MEMEKPTYIKIEHHKITYGFYWSWSIEGEYISAYIPAYDIYFSCKGDIEKATKRAKIMVRAFFDFWVKNQGEKSFFLQLHKLGFRTNNHNYTLKRLLNKEKFDTQFYAPERPSSFEGFNATVQEGELEFA
jgi:hypothetical protein